MKVFWTIVLIIKVIVLLVLLLLFFPFILLWFWIRFKTHRAALVRELRKAGLPEPFVTEAANELRMQSLFNSLWKREKNDG